MTHPGAVHPIVAAVELIESAFKDVADLDPMFMTTADKATTMTRLVQIQSRTTELLTRVMMESHDVAAASAARSVGSWLHHTTRTSWTTSRRLHHLANDLHHQYRHLGDALRAGTITIDQADVICHALGDLPEATDTTTRLRAELKLIDSAAQFDPQQLRHLGRRILHVLYPNIEDDHDAKKLAELERSAAQKTRLTLTPQSDGTTRISGLIPDHAATRLATYLHAWTNPRKTTDSTWLSTQIGNQALGRLPHATKLGHAFCTLIETLDPARLPIHGGDATTLILTMKLDDLRAGLGTATVLGTPDGGIDEISAHQARRLACNAGIIPAVLNGKGHVLDLGRSQRLFTSAQRKALLLRDPTCRAQGCTVTGTWTEAHHWDPWSHGGRTDLSNAVLLCAHHHRAHDPTYHVQRLPNGDIRYNRRR